MPLLQRKWSDEQVASAKSMKHTKHVKSSVLFVYVHRCLCHTPRVCVRLWLPLNFALDPYQKQKPTKPASQYCVSVCVCVCVHECSLVCASECVYLQALEHVLCKENTATQKKYSHAQHTLSHKHTTHTLTHTQERKKQYTFKIKHK